MSFALRFPNGSKLGRVEQEPVGCADHRHIDVVFEFMFDRDRGRQSAEASRQVLLPSLPFRSDPFRSSSRGSVDDSTTIDTPGNYMAKGPDLSANPTVLGLPAKFSPVTQHGGVWTTGRISAVFSQTDRRSRVTPPMAYRRAEQRKAARRDSGLQDRVRQPDARSGPRLKVAPA